ncbi:PI-PLC X domain-containing protein At5g67130-like [Rhododendron vialii]|uniref:PI-PLC X domain-containing protein At5g67130-like n=1 Tax=Rhododendron vialii TaxID=182163 RepID=UPI00265F55E7|nr:PI-PLC X domain-containing protein At5g67130-like [Rhododendron vialii]
MGGLVSNIILIGVSVLHYVILSPSALSDHQQHQIKGVNHQYARSNFSDPFKIVFPASMRTNTEDSVTRQLNSPAIYLFQEVEEFLNSNPSEIVTLILEDQVETPNGLAKIFNVTGLAKYMLPLSKMPRYGGDWPRVKDMVAANQRLVVFSSSKAKEESEGIAYQGNFVVEYKYGRRGKDTWNCTKRDDDLSPLEEKRKSLVLLNYHSTPIFARYYNEMNSKDLMNATHKCYTTASNNWANFIAVDYGKGIDVRPAFQAVDFLNGKLLCGCDDVNSCRGGSWCPSEVEFGIMAKVFKIGYVSGIIFFILCVVLGYVIPRIVRYIKKSRYKLKR